VPFRVSHGKDSPKEDGMSDDHVYRVIEITGSSSTSISDAIQVAVSRASKTLRNLRWFEVVQTRGHLDGGKIQHYQVTLKIGFTIDESNAGA
jgi:dodecin